MNSEKKRELCESSGPIAGIMVSPDLGFFIGSFE